MGSGPSKFRKHLQNGDEYMALQLFNSRSDLHKHLDPNTSYGENYDHNTPMHYAAHFAMKSLLRIFLAELGGNPNKRNVRNETILHCLCNFCENHLGTSQRIRRIECLLLVLQWVGPILHDGNAEKANLAAKDDKENTPLHYAAMSGLNKMVEILVNQNAPLFLENLQKETPCDSAEKSGHNVIAVFLESKMVFSNDDRNLEDLETANNMALEENYSGLRAQDLQEAKDQLLVETSDMLNVPLFTAEVLLRNHEWSREILLEAWIRDAVGCCNRCGINPPSNVLQEHATANNSLPSLHSELQTTTASCSDNHQQSDCCICTFVISSTETPVLISCGHLFCRTCWEIYLSRKIQEGDAYNIMCPGFECNVLVPVEIIETLVSRDMARRYLQFDIKAFVECNPSIKWCPNAECGRAVRLPEADALLSPSRQSSSVLTSSLSQQPSETSRAVDCGNGHTFCWDCLGEAHEPASCYNWKNWFIKISEIKPEELTGMEENTETSANCLWLITNSKPCPNCKSPIQKNEGCNHMKCSKCKNDFCWVCLEAWKKHSTATGGYFRCNRYEAVKKVEEEQDILKAEAEVKNKKLQELNRFVHYYSRFKNHENSHKLEVPLFMTAKEKMMILARAVPTTGSDVHEETKFVEEAVTQLLKARHILKCSYVYGYYLEETGYRKPIFEFMQTELEECTEVLSEMVARPYLRTPRHKIVQAANLVQRKRHEFVSAVSKGLVPPDNSPSRRKKKMFTFKLDDETRKALLASLSDDASNMWVKDASGRHGNVAALLDWPEESDESDPEIPSPSKFPTTLSSLAAAGRSSGVSTMAEAVLPLDQQEEEAVADVVCLRSECTQIRAMNPRTGRMHEHCSMRCMKMDRLEKQKSESTSMTPDFIPDYHLDLLRALEISRNQYIQEMECLNVNGSPSLSPCTPQSYNETKKNPNNCFKSDATESNQPNLLFDTQDDDSRISLAIELSMDKSPSRQIYSNQENIDFGESSNDIGGNNQNFGPIKHLNITNINYSTSDKTAEFLSKDISHLFKKRLATLESCNSSSDSLVNNAKDKILNEENFCTCQPPVDSSLQDYVCSSSVGVLSEQQPCNEIGCCNFKFDETVVNISNPWDHKSRSRHLSPLQFSDPSPCLLNQDPYFLSSLPQASLYVRLDKLEGVTVEPFTGFNNMQEDENMFSRNPISQYQVEKCEENHDSASQTDIVIDSKILESLLAGFEEEDIVEKDAEDVDGDNDVPAFYYPSLEFQPPEDANHANNDR